MSWYALCVTYVGVHVDASLWDASMTAKNTCHPTPPTRTHTSMFCYICNLKNDYVIKLIVTKGNRVLTSVRTGYEGKLALILMSIQVLQGTDNLTTLCCIHTTYLQPGQVIPHVSVNDNIRRTHLLEIVQKTEPITVPCVNAHRQTSGQTCTEV